MLSVGSPHISQHALFPRCFVSTSSCVPFNESYHCSSVSSTGTISLRWSPVGEFCMSNMTKLGGLHKCLASQGSSEQPNFVSEKSLWPNLFPRPVIYSSNISDVDPVQLSELWAVTLKVRRDPKKILRALRHSFAFVIVLAHDEQVSSSSGPCLKIVGVGRAISDGTFIASICDVAVDPAYQHRGIGRRIVRKLVENMKKTGGPSGYAVFPPPVARRFFWMIGFRLLAVVGRQCNLEHCCSDFLSTKISDKKYRLMAYCGKGDERRVKLVDKELMARRPE